MYGKYLVFAGAVLFSWSSFAVSQDCDKERKQAQEACKKAATDARNTNSAAAAAAGFTAQKSNSTPVDVTAANSLGNQMIQNLGTSQETCDAAKTQLRHACEDAKANAGDDQALLDKIQYNNELGDSYIDSWKEGLQGSKEQIGGYMIESAMVARGVSNSR